MKIKKSLGFTLVEITLVLLIIGVLSAVLVPLAFQAAPDENVLKFKKTYSTLGTVIRELATSDAYFKDGNFTKKAKGGSYSAGYLCEAMAELMSYKSKDCSSDNANEATGYVSVYYDPDGGDSKSDMTSQAKEDLDTNCADAQHAQIITNDKVSWFEANNNELFNSTYNGTTAEKDGNGFLAKYKIICFDVDGVGKGEAPFGFGVRGDGKLLSGKRADEWVEKSVQRGGNDD